MSHFIAYTYMRANATLFYSILNKELIIKTDLIIESDAKFI